MSNPAWNFLKAHGTENDFVVLVDPEVSIELSESTVQQLADRRAGIGGDGVIRIATAGKLLERGVLNELPGDCQESEWFMDYRNSDGSLAEMCGNGVRVFAHVLAEQGLVPVEGETHFGIGTRDGRKAVTIHHADAQHAMVSVEMGSVTEIGDSRVEVAGIQATGLGVDVGNPHAVVILSNLTQDSLRELPVGQPVTWDPELFPHGVNVEVVTPLQADAIHMRVHERGVGETRSCGTGTVAAAFAALRNAGRSEGTVAVNVPGGQVEVTLAEGRATLKGPSQIIATGEYRG